ncbi:uncharacterized protein LOC131211555 [Anopheles bellator]|uniref:uncharacterized protein LOC131211555 n=1 Tax=Anopheles bellator TaxID=139047 RepID=UPI002648DEF3|nr:uncharacterized protein LOC131211555 [Anopheles bellator]
MPKPPKSKEPKIPPEEARHALLQQQEEQAADEQRRLREKAAQNLKEYNQRRVLLVESVKLFRRLEKSASDYRRQQADRKEWSDFVSCRKPPDPASAPELRAALYQWTYRREQHEKSSVSWTLAADERSPLTQDTAVSERKTTRQDLRQLYRNIGAIYVPTVREALAVLKSIEDGVAGAEPQPEVLLARDEIRKFISDSLDRMTFRVGSNLARDMEVLDPVMCEFQYASDIVAIYFWSFRHVPLPPDYNLLMKAVNMAPLRLILHRPPGFDLKNALIRGLWHGFDHYSSMDPTRVVGPLPAPAKELIAAQELEWNERQEVRRKRLTALRQLRDDYENEQRRKQAEAEALAAEQQKPGAFGGPPKPAGGKGKGVKRGAKKGKTKQGPEPVAVPAVITGETEVDIDDEYERQQSDQFRDTLEPIGPKSLPLRDGYLNLREYGITGGVYKLTRFAKLPQPVELRSDFIFTCKPVGLDLSESQPEYRALESDEVIKIELHLPAGCFWWEEPTVCRWEPWEESDTFRQLSPAVQRFHLQYDQIRAHEASRLFTARATGPRQTKVVPDFRLVDVPVEIRRHYLIREHILPRLPEGYRFHAELKQLYSILRERTTRRKALDREQLARNELMLKYDRFLQANQQPREWPSFSELRLPTEADIGSERNAVADSRRKTPNAVMDAKLDHLSLLHPAHPRYLHPPQPVARRPLTVAAKDPDSTAQTMEELERSLEACISADDDEAGERLCDMFSTFLNLLAYLRDKEKPAFPSLPVPGAEDPVPTVKHVSVRAGTREFKHRHLASRPSSRKSLTQELRGRPQEPKRTRKRKKSLTKRSHSVAVEQPDRATSEDRSKTDGILTRIEHEPGRWSTKAIHSQSYDPVGRVLTFWTDRLGVYGLAARRYSLLPLRQWDMRRLGRVADLTTVISLRTGAGLEIVFSVTSGGYRVQVGQEHREPPNEEVVVPRHDELSLEELQELLATLNLHLFPQPDTCFYTTGMPAGAHKHEPMELHNLRCLAVFCLTHHFRHCLWNRYADRRTALVRCRQLIEGRPEPELETIKITPLGVLTVEVEELCSPTLEQILLAYHPRPADQSYNADGYGLLKGTLEEPSRKALAKTPPLLQWNVGQLLQKLRLLSYS